MPTIEDVDVCCRCGGIGHTIKNCKIEIDPTILLRSRLKRKILDVSGSVPADWREDSISYYLPSKYKRNFASKSWKDGEFCYNCGEFGHNESNCAMISKNSIEYTVGDFVEGRPKLSDKERKQYFQKIFEEDGIQKGFLNFSAESSSSSGE